MDYIRQVEDGRWEAYSFQAKRHCGAFENSKQSKIYNSLDEAIADNPPASPYGDNLLCWSPNDAGVWMKKLKTTR